MLPMESYFLLLACIARADGEVVAQESELVQVAAVNAGLTGEGLQRVNEALDLNRSFDMTAALDEIATQASPTFLAEGLRDAYVVAGCDGDIAPVEIEVIETLMRKLDIDERRRAVLHSWARTAAEQHLDGIALIAESMGRASLG